MAGRELGRRVGVAAIGIPFALWVVYLGSWAVAVVLALTAALGAREVYRLASARGWHPFTWIGVPAAALLVLAAGWTGTVESWSVVAWWILIGLTLLAMAGAVVWRDLQAAPLVAVASTIFGVIYVGATLAFAVLLRAFPETGGGEVGWEGAFLLIFPLVATWSGDSAAYFVGRRWGRRKLLPAVSPGKTVEGGVGGLIGATLGAGLFALLLLGPGGGVVLPALSGAFLGLVIGGVAQVGDLAESLLKREAGVKDSGSLLPGHGGVLDRFDSVFFTLPVTYALLPFFLQS